VTTIDVFMMRGAKQSEVRWGQIPDRAQYVLIFLAVTFTWLMGLMGYVRSGLRQHWHVYGVIRDNSPDAFTPTLGFATRVVSMTVLLFFVLVGFVFWLASLSGKRDHLEALSKPHAHAPEPAEHAVPGGALPAPSPSAGVDLS
jgi:cytochrome bd-type quinol oxidase subunit 1